MRLSKLLKNIEVIGELNDVEISDVVSDSRKVSKGSLYVCIQGNNFDGHTVAQQMLQKGAAAVVVQRDIGLKNQIIVKDTRTAWGSICANFFGNPGDKLKLIGLTGTNGKTTTSFIIKQILEGAGKTVGLIGTVQNMIGDQIHPAKYTTPESYELQKLFKMMVDASCEYCVMEVSSQALAQGRVSGCHFVLGAFTNLTQDHLDYHHTWENYFNAKRKLFVNSDIAVTNADDEYGFKILDGLPCKVVSYGVANKADFMAKDVSLTASGISYELVSDGKTGKVSCKIPGKFSVYNSLCAIACALAMDIDFNVVINAIDNIQGVKGRIEVVPTGTDYTVIIDYAHSPDGLENIIESMREVVKGKIITVFGCGGDRDKTKRPIMGKIASHLSDFCVVTSDNPRSENPSAIIEDILVGVRESKTPYKVVESRRDAIKYAMDIAQKNDIIILAGKGHETYQILPDGTIHFDEREVVAEILNG